MQIFALASDYDGTLAHHGRVDETTLAAVRRLRESGRRFLLVTGRELDELAEVFPQLDLCDWVVAENGALLCNPATRESRVLAEPPPPEFAEALKRRGVREISVGHVIVATWEPYEKIVLETIRDLGLELQVIFNKGAVMVLPSGVNKASGLTAALAELGVSPHNTVGVGDAENDHAFLSLCRLAVAVDNALPAVKERADLVTRRDHGAGVVELIDGLIADELAGAAAGLTRHSVLVGRRDDGGEESFSPLAGGILVAGTSGSGKSTLTTGLLERLHAGGYQVAILDPEGDYAELDFAVALGSPGRAPLIEEVLDLLRDPGRNAVVNLLGIALEHRPEFIGELLPRLLEMRARTGRPHVLVLDEAHHLLPADRPLPRPHLPERLDGALAITVHPASVHPAVLGWMDLALTIGEQPARTLAEFCETAAVPVPAGPDPERLSSGDALLWRRGQPRTVLVQTEPPKSERLRHSRKYAEGNLGPDLSFYFRGSEGKLNLKAQNLTVFLQMADGVDDDTWEFHRRRGEYSRWLRESVKDADLAAEVEAVERSGGGPKESRAAVRAAVEHRYTLPADRPSGLVDTPAGLSGQ